MSGQGGCSAYKTDKYPDLPEDVFCGPEGGSCPRTYPVDSEKRWKSALSYARFAPNPEGIRRCANRIAEERGWKK